MKKFKLKNSLSIKLLKIVFLVYIIVTILTISLQIYFQHSMIKDEIAKEVISIEKNFKEPLSAAIWNFSIEETDTIVKAIYNQEFISGVELVDKNGLVIKSLGETKIKEQLISSFTITRVYKEKLLSIGSVEIYSDPDIIFEKLIENIYFIIKNTLLLFIVCAIVLLVVFYKYLTQPLNRLTVMLEELHLDNIEKSEILLENIDIDKNDKNELELLKGSFRTMLEKILSSSKELNDLNKTLEEKVQKRTENLENEKNKFQTFLNATMEAIFISKDGICIDVNKSAVEIFGYGSKEEMIGKKLIDFISSSSKEVVLEKLKQQDVSPYEGVVERKDKTTFIAYLRGVNVLKGEKIRVSSIIDISHIKQLESQARLVSMGEMIGNIAHQWRQPLSVISTAASGMQLSKEMGVLSDEEFTKLCTHINENAQYLSQTIDDFKNFVKGDTKEVNFNLKSDTDSFIKLIDTTVKNHNIKLILDLEEHIDINGYPNELIQCFMNIFNNSKDAFIENEIPEDERFVFITQKVIDKSVVISFKDNAGGIPENIIGKVFDPYFTTKFKSQGTGLGLHMSYNLIVTHMQGTVEVTNSQYELNGKNYTGAVFTISLPLV